MDVKKDTLRESVFAITRWVGSPRSVILHSLVFIASFAVAGLGLVELDRMLLVLTTLVSLEAIYLSLFIQMTVNFQGETIEAVEQDIDEIQEDIDEIQEDVEEIVEDDKEDEAREQADHKTLEEIRAGLGRLMQDLERLQSRK
jgi:hypothetical protein